MQPIGAIGSRPAARLSAAVRTIGRSRCNIIRAACAEHDGRRQPTAFDWRQSSDWVESNRHWPERHGVSRIAFGLKPPTFLEHRPQRSSRTCGVNVSITIARTRAPLSPLPNPGEPGHRRGAAPFALVAREKKSAAKREGGPPFSSYCDASGQLTSSCYHHQRPRRQRRRRLRRRQPASAGVVDDVNARLDIPTALRTCVPTLPAA